MDTMWKQRKKIAAILLVGMLLLAQIVPQRGILSGTDQGSNAAVVMAASVAEKLTPTVDEVLTSVKQYMLKVDTKPDYVSSTWNVIGLSRSGLDVPQEYYDTYYKNTIAYLKENNWTLSKSKYSDYSKLIIAMTAIGKDARNIEGHNLLAYLSDFKNVKKQGFNGPIWALIALKSHPDYTIPVDTNASEQTTEEGLVQYILDKEVWSGGWTLTGNIADADITGMAIQALSFYYGERTEVTEAIDRALEWLSKSQLASGGYATLGTETSESVSQIIVALSSIGVDGAKDERFIKNGKWPMTGLFQYYLSEGGFMHVAAGAGNNGGGEAGTLDGMATEQGFYATVAYKRMLDGRTALYDMSDVTLPKTEGNEGQNGQDTGSPPSATTATETTTAVENTTHTIKMIRLILDYSEITLKKGKTKTLYASISPANATNQKLKWSTSDKKIATVTQKGKVKGKKAGTATITVAAKDGSGLKATCKVTVIVSKETTTSQSTTSNRSETKKVNLVSSTGKTTSTTAATSDATTATASDTAESTEAGDQAVEDTGWNFAGEDYVPETATEEGEEFPETEADSKELLPGATSEDYIMLGAGSTLLIEFILWAIWCGWKKGKAVKNVRNTEKEA